jgi:hypothetical protein
MTVETDIRELLAGHAPLMTLVNAIALAAVPEKTELPWVTYTVAHSPLLAVDGTKVGDQCSVTLECWAGTAREAGEVADAATAAVSLAPLEKGATVTERASSFDPETGLDGVVLLVTWWD